MGSHGMVPADWDGAPVFEGTCDKSGDRELLNTRPGVKIYRLHIGRSFTAIYVIEEHSVLVTEVMTIEQRRTLTVSSRPPGLKTSHTGA